MKAFKKTMIFAVGLLLLAGCAVPFASSTSSSQAVADATSTEEPVVQLVSYAEVSPSGSSVISTLQNAFRSIYTSVNPSVVNIQVTEAYGFSVVSGEGSGFVWDTEGDIVTNNHVVEGAINITVLFSDGTSAEAQVVGTDAQSDLAVIKVDPSEHELIPVTTGDSQTVQVGDLVIAIGNPYGLSGTMTQGIVSALSRSLTVDDSDSPWSQVNYTIPDIIQTDAAINPGNSGGVLVNVDGEVIGVTAAIQSSTNSNAGIGFVIPMHIVEKVVPVLIEKGKFEHPSLGLSGTTLTPSLVSAMDLESGTQGVLITSIQAGGAAARANLVPTTQQFTRPGRVTTTYGDVVTAIDGRKVTGYEDLVSYIFNSTEVGQVVSLTILRDGEQMTVQVTLQAD